ncbi:MAG TPA: hypothetical protein DDX14_02825, partial [Cyanobacteria bacterium UBA9579]|nr:hypothetical protein [Cyanobacteria bacterium UBA9579]
KTDNINLITGANVTFNTANPYDYTPTSLATGANNGVISHYFDSANGQATPYIRGQNINLWSYASSPNISTYSNDGAKAVGINLEGLIEAHAISTASGSITLKATGDTLAGTSIALGSNATVSAGEAGGAYDQYNDNNVINIDAAKINLTDASIRNLTHIKTAGTLNITSPGNIAIDGISSPHYLNANKIYLNAGSGYVNVTAGVGSGVYLNAINNTNEDTSTAYAKLGIGASSDISFGARTHINSQGDLGIATTSGNLNTHWDDTLLTADNNLYVYANAIKPDADFISNNGNIYMAFEIWNPDDGGYRYSDVKAANGNIYLGYLPSDSQSILNIFDEDNTFGSRFKTLTNYGTDMTMNLLQRTTDNSHNEFIAGGIVNIKSPGSIFINGFSNGTSYGSISGSSVYINANGQTHINDVLVNATTGNIDISNSGDILIDKVNAPNTYLYANSGNIGIGSNTGNVTLTGATLNATNLGLGSVLGNITINPSTSLTIGNNLYTYSNIFTVNTVNLTPSGNIYSAFNNMKLLNGADIEAVGNIYLGTLPSSGETISSVFNGSSFAERFGGYTNKTGDLKIELISNLSNITSTSGIIDVDSNGNVNIAASFGTPSASLNASSIYINSPGVIALNNFALNATNGNIGIGSTQNISTGNLDITANNLGIGSTTGAISLFSYTDNIGNIYAYTNQFTIGESLTINNNAHLEFNLFRIFGNEYLQVGNNINLGFLPDPANADSIQNVFNGTKFATRFGNIPALNNNMEFDLRDSSGITSNSGNIYINSAANLLLNGTSATTNPDPTITATTGSIYLNAGGTTTITDVNLSANATSGLINIDSTGNVLFNGTSTLPTFSANKINLDSDGNVTIGSHLTAVNNLGIGAKTGITIQPDVNVNSTSGNLGLITETGTISIGGGATAVSAAGNMYMYGNTINLDARYLNATNKIYSSFDTLSLSNDAKIRTTNGNITFGSLGSGGDAFGTIFGGTSVGTRFLTLTALTGNTAISLLSSGTSVESGGNLNIDSGGNLVINGPNFTQAYFNATSAYFNADGTINMKHINLNTDTATGSIIFDSIGNILLNGTYGTTITSRDIYLNTSGSLTIENTLLNATNNLGIGSADGLMLGTGSDLRGPGNLGLGSETGNITIGSGVTFTGANIGNIYIYSNILSSNSSIATIGNIYSAFNTLNLNGTGALSAPSGNIKLGGWDSIDGGDPADLFTGSAFATTFSGLTSRAGNVNINLLAGGERLISPNISIMSAGDILINGTGSTTIKNLTANATGNLDILSSDSLYLNGTVNTTLTANNIFIDSDNLTDLNNLTLITRAGSAGNIGISGNNGVTLGSDMLYTQNTPTAGNIGLFSQSGPIDINSDISSAGNMYYYSENATNNLLAGTTLAATGNMYLGFKELQLNTGRLNAGQTLYLGSGVPSIGWASGHEIYNELGDNPAAVGTDLTIRASRVLPNSISAGNKISILLPYGNLTLIGESVDPSILNATSFSMSLDGSGTHQINNILFNVSASVPGSIGIKATAGDLQLTNVTAANANITELAAVLGNITATDSALTSSNNSYIFGNILTFNNSTISAAKIYSAFDTLSLDSLSSLTSTGDLYLGNITSASVSEADILATDFKALLDSYSSGSTIGLAGGTPLASSAGTIYINSAGNISLTGSVPTTLSSNGMYINSTGIGTNTLGNITFDPKTGNLQINANSGILTLDAVSSTLANTTNIDISSNTSTIQNSDLNASGYVNLISNTGTTSINNSNMSAAGNFNVTGNTGISLTGSGNTLSGGMVKFLSSNGDIGITGYNITGSIGLFTNSTGNINLTNSDLNYGDDLYLYGSDFTFTNSLLTNATATGKIFAAFDSLTLVSPRNILAGNNIYFGNINNLLVTQNNILSDKFKELNLANPLSGSTIDLAGATVSSNSGSMYIKSTGNLLSSNSALSTLSANGIFINSTGAGTNTLGNITFNPKAGSLQINA